MEGMEIFFLTEKSVVEAVYYRGKSSDKEIFELMLRLVYLELMGCFRLHIIWASGTRKTAAVIDGFKKGCLIYRIASSGFSLDFMPLHETGFERLAPMLPWVQTWIGVNRIEPLTHEGWFEEGLGMKG